ncbi:hypothetical protein SUGI_1125770 [Cryptomeria japonica]|nr:hypothetical protein SUGI_1125770 [Cryptomeria japonica]
MSPLPESSLTSHSPPSILLPLAPRVPFHSGSFHSLVLPKRSHSLKSLLGLKCLTSNIPLNNLSIHDWDCKLVVNLSNVILDPLVVNVLKMGFRFVLSPRTILHVDFLIDIENVIRSLSHDLAEEVRQDCVVSLRHAKPSRCNVLKVELLAFNNLLKNKKLIKVMPWSL